MKLKIKKLHQSAIIPSYAKPGDAGMDLTAIRVEKELPKGSRLRQYVCHTGLALEIPEGFVGLIFPRSSISSTELTLANSVGVIDSGYRGEIILKFNQPLFFTTSTPKYKVGDRVGQLILMPIPKVEIEEVGFLSEAERGMGGFGSSGR